MQLKEYQSRTLQILSDFLIYAKGSGNVAAFEKYQDAQGYSLEYQPLRNLEDVPYICLRLPTGGGKTLIGSHAIHLAAENYIEHEFPFVLWFVPSKEIQQQTLRVLKDPKSFYNQFLRNTFDGRLNIFEAANFRGLRSHDLTQKLNICVSTFQSFKITDKEGRKVYQSDEVVAACFEDIPYQSYFISDEKGRYHSFANLLSYIRPLMIVDEAHNYSTDLSFDITKILRPSAVIELTATPASNSNVLVKVTAEELHREEMIKLPIILGEVPDSANRAIDFAVQKRAALEKIAASESEYIRPIALYQAESKNREFNVDYVRKYLIESAKIPENEIAIATGEKHELDGVNLFLRACPIRHIITVQALKEGWDCPFASVFCSLSNTHSPKDAEQLLGRVLRMPYAKRRSSPELNQAYAFFRVDSWTKAVDKIKDNLTGMGFDKDEISSALGRQKRLFNQKITFEIQTKEPPNIDSLNMILQNQIEVEKTEEGCNITFKDVTDDDLIELEGKKNKIFKKPDDRNKFSQAIYEGFFASPKEKSPAARGIEFSIPQLCLDFGNNDIQVITDREDFELPADWTLTGMRDYDLPLSRAESNIQFYEFTLQKEKIKSRMLLDEDQNLFKGKTNWTQSELVDWFNIRIINRFISPEDCSEFTRRVLNQLMNEKNFSIDELVRMRFTIEKLLKEKIQSCLDKAYKQSCQTILFNTDFPIVCVTKDIAFTFNPSIYPAKKFHMGTEQFNKHFYPKIGYMNNEEIVCAQYIDSNPKVETWIRNIEKEPNYSFWLQTSKDKFYPDFVVKLKNGSYAAIEYKGAHLADNSDTEEKTNQGEIWANKSGGLCKFLMAVKKDKNGRDLSTQIKELLI